MTIAFVLGNGKSRLEVDLHALKKHGKIYGCNALYRDFTPDVLVATDRPMATEIEKSGYPFKHEFWTRNPELRMGAKKITLNFGYSSGPVAITLAAFAGHNPIYLIGFDLVGINGKINNVYAGTPNYRPKSENEIFYGNWINQLYVIAKDQYPNTKFIRVVNAESFTPNEWKMLPNYAEINFEDLKRNINTSSWKQNE